MEQTRKNMWFFLYSNHIASSRAHRSTVQCSHRRHGQCTCIAHDVWTFAIQLEPWCVAGLRLQCMHGMPHATPAPSRSAKHGLPTRTAQLWPPWSGSESNPYSIPNRSDGMHASASPLMSNDGSLCLLQSAPSTTSTDYSCRSTGCRKQFAGNSHHCQQQYFS